MATGSRREMARIREAVPGTLPPTPAFKILRNTGGKGVSLKRDKLDNAEYRSDRGIVAVRLGNNKVGAEAPFNLIYGEYDDLLASSLFSSWTHKSGVTALTPQTLSITATLNTFTRASGSFVTDGFRVGDQIQVSGFATAANNRIWTITAVTALALTLTGLAAEAATNVTFRLAEAAAPYALALTGLTTSVAGQITRAAGSFITDGIAVGDVVRLSGMNVAGNNGVDFPVTAVTATVLTITGFLADTATTGRVRQKQILQDSIYPATFSIEERQTDIAVFQSCRGALVNQAALSLKPNSMLTGKFDLIAMIFGAVTTASIANSIVQAGTNQPFDTFTGSLKEGGTTLATIVGLDLAVNNGATAKYFLFNQNAGQIDPDDSNVTGTLQAYFVDKSLLDKFTNETLSSLVVTVIDLLGNAYEITVPSLKYLDADEALSKKDVTYSLPFQALRDSTLGCHLQIARIPV